jgi:hypothetical protein
MHGTKRGGKNHNDQGRQIGREFETHALWLPRESRCARRDGPPLSVATRHGLVAAFLPTRNPVNTARRHLTDGQANGRDNFRRDSFFSPECGAAALTRGGDDGGEWLGCCPLSSSARYPVHLID